MIKQKHGKASKKDPWTISAIKITVKFMNWRYAILFTWIAKEAKSIC